MDVFRAYSSLIGTSPLWIVDIFFYANLNSFRGEFDRQFILIIFIESFKIYNYNLCDFSLIRR